MLFFHFMLTSCLLLTKSVTGKLIQTSLEDRLEEKQTIVFDAWKHQLVITISVRVCLIGWLFWIVPDETPLEQYKYETQFY